jgi:anti-sigma regulatory factor (Ser/Thr protein kinase)
MIERLRRSPFPELGFFGVAALLLFAYEYLDRVARQEPIDPLVPLIEEGTGVMGACLLFFGVRRLARAVPARGSRRVAALGFHVTALAGFSAAHTTLNWTSREALFRLTGLGDYDYGVMPVRYLMELPIDVILYTSFVAGVWSADRWRNERTRERDHLQLESRLARARLQNLQLQLQPHFLFNALNAISSVMYQDPAAADAMIARLAELLRYALRTADVHEVPLGDELDALDHYVTLLGARFGEDFACVREIDPDARAVLVPALVLQPLVENAVRHGNLARIGQGRVTLRLRRAGGLLRVEVEDDGPGVGPGRDVMRDGVGLATTAERLRLLYGAAHGFEAHNVDGGFRVTLEVPWREVREAAARAPSPGGDRACA